LKSKTGKHLTSTARLGRIFTPFILHSGGGLAPKALTFVKSLSRAASSRLAPEPARRFHPDWMQRYSCTVQRMAADTLRHSEHYITADGGSVHSSPYGGYVHGAGASRLADPAVLRCRCGPVAECHCLRDRRPNADFARHRPRPSPASPQELSPAIAPSLASAPSSPVAVACSTPASPVAAASV
jgi:hypothetical protein